MYKIMTAEEMANRIRSNVKQKKKLYKEAGKLFACLIETKAIHDSEEGFFYDSKFWFSVIKRINPNINPEILRWEPKMVTHCINCIYRDRKWEMKKPSIDYLKELKELEKLGEDLSNSFDETLLEGVGFQNPRQASHQFEEYVDRVNENKKYYKRISKYFAILLEMAQDYRYAIYNANSDMPLNHSLILNSKKEFGNALFALREVVGAKDRIMLEMILQLSDVVRMINECYPEFLDSGVDKTDECKDEKENEYEIIRNATEPLKVQTETPETVKKSEYIVEDAYEVRIVDYFPEAYDLVDDSVDIRVPDHMNYKDFVEYLHREEIQKSMCAAKFWDMVVSETEKINNDMKDRYHEINQNHEGYRPYIVHDFLKALIRFYSDAEQYTVFAYCRIKYSRTTILHKFGRNTGVYCKLLLPNYVNGKMTIDDIVYITMYKPQTIKMDLHRYYGQNFSYEELYPNTIYAKRANKD